MADEIRRSALGRTARLAALPVGYAGRAGVGVGKRLVGRPADRVLTEVQRRTADQLFSVLGELKGGAMKLGQAMSIFETALPEELAGPYRETLTRLQDAAPPMSPGTLDRVLAAELGPDWRSRFREVGEQPVAAASIGQVHRATWHDGTEVAVKVQYPGAARALRSDLRQLSRMSRMFAVLTPGLDVRALLAELQERVVEELDYTLEAEAQAAFAAAYAGDPDVLVPGVVEATERVLVTEWLDSDSSLAAVIADGGPEERDRVGRQYVEFLLASPARVGMLHADPHPGNYRVLADGRLGVLDFGAVARLPEGLPPAMGRLLRLAVEEDWEAVRDGLVEEGFLRQATDLDPERLAAFLGPFVEPATVPRFRFDRAWLRSQAQRVALPTGEGFGDALKLNLPPAYLLVHRVWAGGVGVLCQLEAEVAVRDLLVEHVAGFAD